MVPDIDTKESILYLFKRDQLCGTNHVRTTNLEHAPQDGGERCAYRPTQTSKFCQKQIKTSMVGAIKVHNQSEHNTNW